MSASRKSVVWIGVVLIVGSGLCPPWVSLWGPSGALRKPIGYYWIFLPPTEGFVTLDMPRLLVEWALVVAVSAALLFAAPAIALSDQIRKRSGWLGRVVGWSPLRACPVLRPRTLEQPEHGDCDQSEQGYCYGLHWFFLIVRFLQTRISGDCLEPVLSDK